MRFKNTPHFQQLLQAALCVASEEKDYSDQSVVASAKLTLTKSTLHRFRRADLETEISRLLPGQRREPIARPGLPYLKREDAQRLWEYLSTRDYIERAIVAANFDRRNLYDSHELGDIIVNFYNIQKSQGKKFFGFGLNGSFYCYKPSFRRKGFTVKSKIVFSSIDNEYFSIKEFQKSSGIYEIDGTPIIEHSDGIGFIKSDRLWMFMRDEETEQPRIFCFSEPKFASSNARSVDDTPRNTRLTMMFGYLIEGAEGNAQDAFAFNTVIVSEMADKALWEQEQSRNSLLKGTYDEENQIDIFPTDKHQKSIYEKRKSFFIPEEIVEYLGKSASQVLK